jgi:hypothetical protein
MNENKRLAGIVGFAFCSVVVLALTGCATYAERPGEGGAYYEPSGQADGSYAEIRTESDFYEPLSPYGRWEVVGSYGRCWIPGGVDADWSPYSNGYWQRTDAGWYWASDEPWGWATYHYGRWDSSPQYGWYWVPQTQWAPAWVSWREGGGYVGWAPLGPSGRGVVTVNRRGASPGGYVFVEERRFLEPVRPTTIIVNNTAINKTVINKGPGTAVIEQASGRKMQAVPVRQLRSKEEAKVVAKHPTPPPASPKAVPTPVHNQAEKAPPAREPRQVEQKVIPPPAHNQAENAPPTRGEPRQVEKPAITTAEPQPPAARNQARQADEQSRAAKLDEEKRAQQEKARETESMKRQPVPAAVEAKPEPKAEAKHEAKPEAKAEAKPEAKIESKPEVKRDAQPEAKHETKPEAKVEPKPAAARPAATRESTEQKTGKGDEKQD